MLLLISVSREDWYSHRIRRNAVLEIGVKSCRVVPQQIPGGRRRQRHRNVLIHQHSLTSDCCSRIRCNLESRCLGGEVRRNSVLNSFLSLHINEFAIPVSLVCYKLKHKFQTPHISTPNSPSSAHVSQGQKAQRFLCPTCFKEFDYWSRCVRCVLIGLLRRLAHLTFLDPS